MMATQGTFSNAFEGVGNITINQPTTGNLFDRAVLLSLSISCLGIKRKVQSSEVEVDADKTMISVSKAIIDSPILAEIKKFDGQTRLWINQRSLPSMFRSGVYLWPISLVLDADEYLSQRCEQRRGLVNRFLDAYLIAKVDAQNRLGALYNPADYPGLDKVQAAFDMSYMYIECGVPGRLRDIAPAMFEREREKAERQWTSAIDEAKQLLRDELAGLVSHMVDKTAPGEDGKPKRFKNSLVDNFNRFLELFNPRNLANDDELQAVVAQCRQVLGGSTSEQIRDDAALRDSLHTGFEAIKGQLDSLVVDGGRRIVLDEISNDAFGDI